MNPIVGPAWITHFWLIIYLFKLAKIMWSVFNFKYIKRANKQLITNKSEYN